MNIWVIPDWLEQEVRARDKNCVYCGIEMIQNLPRGHSRKNAATWEHIINDARIVTRENIALCCSPCNSSKGAKLLSDWVQSSYCTTRGVNKDTVAQIVKDALQRSATKAPNKPVQPTAVASGFALQSWLDLDPGGG